MFLLRGGKRPKQLYFPMLCCSFQFGTWLGQMHLCVFTVHIWLKSFWIICKIAAGEKYLGGALTREHNENTHVGQTSFQFHSNMAECWRVQGCYWILNHNTGYVTLSNFIPHTAFQSMFVWSKIRVLNLYNLRATDIRPFIFNILVLESA